MLLLTLSEESEQESLIEEFWEIIPIALDKRRARKAKIAEGGFPEGHPSRDVFRLLYDERMQHSPRKMSRKERQLIDQSWSFSEILNRLQKISNKNKKDGDFLTFLHMYGMASHLAHADHAAMDLLLDRALRSEDELMILQSAYISRITSDIISLALFSSIEAHPLVGGDVSYINDMNICFSRHMALCDPINDLFNKSQEAFYREMDTQV